jgi:hypothetical protein
MVKTTIPIKGEIMKGKTMLRAAICAALCATALVSVLASCSLGMNEVLGRTTSDPYPEIPQARSFVERYTVLLNWSDDEAADEYYLYRAHDDSLAPQYELVYRGPLTGYRDRFTLSHAGEKYLYRLGKRRGNAYFADLSSPGKAALGIVGDELSDIYEPNNNEHFAVLLDSTALIANNWYYASNTVDGLSFYDEDWYCVDIPAHWTAQILLNDILLSGGSIIKRFKIALLNGNAEDITSGLAVEIKNTGNRKERFYFRIFPAWEVFEATTPHSPSGGYGAFTPYDIRIQNLFPG